MSGVLVLSGADIRRLMRPADYLHAMDEVFRAGARVKSIAAVGADNPHESETALTSMARAR